MLIPEELHAISKCGVKFAAGDRLRNAQLVFNI